MNPPLRIAGLLTLAILAWGCTTTSTFNGECKRDSDCKQYQRCDTLDFRCVCSSDQACAQGEYCNPGGSCQRTSGCVSNADCGAGTICDITSGQCIAATKCTEDVQCAIGQICNNGECRLGCKDTSDCDLQKREVCVSGACHLGLCENNLYCDFGYVCDTPTHGCIQPTKPYCQDCSPICSGCTDKTKGPCGDPADLCANTGASTGACWVACQKDEDCPSGYTCEPTTVSWGPVCNQDADCATVSNTCGPSSKRCALNQQPCDPDHCVPPSPPQTQGQCAVSGKQCTTDYVCTSCLALTVTCQLNNCIIGTHCRPPGGCK